MKIEDIIPEFIDSNCELGQRLRDQVKGGQPISEELMVEIIVKRIQFSDCFENGFMLEDFPKTLSQAEKLTESSYEIQDYGILADYVFYLNMYSEKCYSRADGVSNYSFMIDPRIFSQRLTKHLDEKSDVLSFYEHNFGNVKYINGLKSKWYVEETVIEHIRSSLNSKAEFARKILETSAPCALQHINLDRSLMSLCHSNYSYYCPVTWKNHNTFSK